MRACRVAGAKWPLTCSCGQTRVLSDVRGSLWHTESHHLQPAPRPGDRHPQAEALGVLCPQVSRVLALHGPHAPVTGPSFLLSLSPAHGHTLSRWTEVQSPSPRPPEGPSPGPRPRCDPPTGDTGDSLDGLAPVTPQRLPDGLHVHLERGEAELPEEGAGVAVLAGGGRDQVMHCNDSVRGLSPPASRPAPPGLLSLHTCTGGPPGCASHSDEDRHVSQGRCTAQGPSGQPAPAPAGFPALPGRGARASAPPRCHPRDATGQPGSTVPGAGRGGGRTGPVLVTRGARVCRPPVRRRGCDVCPTLAPR